MKILNFLFFGFLFIPMLFRFDVVQDFSDDVILVGKNVSSIRQTFVAKHNNIYLVKLNMNNPQLSASPWPMFFQLTTNYAEPQSLVAIPFSSANIGSNYSLRLQFAPIADSAGKSYNLELNFPKEASGSALEIRRSKQDIYPEGNAYINGIKTNGDLAFKVYYKVSLLQFVRDSGADILMRLGQDVEFVAVYLSIILILVGLTIFSFIRND